jgi:hypothetical protein
MLEKNLTIKQYLIILIIVLTSWTTYSQSLIQLKNENGTLKHNLFKTIDVVSNTPLQVFLIDNNGKKNYNIFSQKIPQVLKTYFSNYESNAAPSKLIIKIQKFNAYEESNNNLIQGKIEVELQAYLVFDGDSTAVCKSRGNSTYSRSKVISDWSPVRKQYQVAIDLAYKFIVDYLKKNAHIFDSYATDSQVIIEPFLVKNQADTLYYQQRKATWSDFKGESRPHSKYGAAIFTSFGIKTKLYTEHGTIFVKVTPMVFMVKNMSWTRKDMLTNYALKHEQLHFDITYLNVLKFLSELKKLKAKSEKDLISMVNFQYLEFYKKNHKVQEQYDEETDHSLIETKQSLWEEKILKELKEYPVNQLFYKK